MKNFHVVCGLLCNQLVKAGNCEHFLGMKVKTWNSKFFTMNNKQYMVFLNQAHAGHRLVLTWFLRIAFVQKSVCVCMCVCVRARTHAHVCIPAPEAINN